MAMKDMNVIPNHANNILYALSQYISPFASIVCDAGPTLTQKWSFVICL